MRTALLIAGSSLALAIAAPAFAQVKAPLALPTAGAVAPVTAGLPKPPTVRPRVGHSDRPSLKLRAPVSRAPLVGGRTFAQVKAPRHPGDSRILKAHSSSVAGLTGHGVETAVKRNGVQTVALGQGRGVNTKSLGVPLTPPSALGQQGRGALTNVSTASALGKTVGGGANNHGVVGANLGGRPGLVTTATGHRH